MKKEWIHKSWGVGTWISKGNDKKRDSNFRENSREDESNHKRFLESVLIELELSSSGFRVRTTLDNQ